MAGIRTGAAFVESLRDDRRVFVGGEVVTDVTEHPAFRGILGTLSSLYDAQHRPELRDVLTYVSPATGSRVSKTYFEARTLPEMRERMRCEHARADATYGLMGRLSDFMSAWFVDSVASLEAMGKREEAERARWYLAHARENDLAITHTLIDPQSDRSKPNAPSETVRIVERRGDGIVVSGARLLSTLAPVANEIYVGPFVPRRPGEEAAAVAFSLPAASAGLKIVCREPYDAGRSTFDRPLSSRFDEGDAILLFDDVFVPEERVVVAGDLEAYNGLLPGFPGYVMLQAVVRSTAKLRFLIGLAAIAARVTGRDKVSRYQEMIGGLVNHLEVAEAIQDGVCLEVVDRLDAQRQGLPYRMGRGPGEPKHQARSGFAAITSFFPMANQAAVDVVRGIAGSGALSFTQKDLENPELEPLLARFVHGPGISARDRLQVMKLVWDATGEPFGSRQALYERYYAGDPIKNRELSWTLPKRVEAEEMVLRILGWPDASGSRGAGERSSR